MSNQNRYDPEDLELLLQSKTFSELLPEEKAFVLQHVENDAEYDSMRETLLNLDLLPELDQAIVPKAETKQNLMQAFEAAHGTEALSEDEEPSKMAAWWMWFWNTNKSIFQRPAFQLASLALLVTLVTYITTFNVDNQVAQVNETPKEETAKTSEPSKEKTSIPKQQEEPLDALKNEVTESEELLEQIPTVAAEDLEIEVTDQVAEKELLAENEVALKDVENRLELEEDVVEMDDSKVNDALESIPNGEEAESFTFDNTVELVPATTASPEAIYIDESADFTQLDLERTTTGNAAYFDSGQYTLKTDELVKAEEEFSPPLMASNFSNLLSKLHTSE